MKITNIDKTTAIMVGNRVEEALAALGEELGLKFQLGRGTFSADKLDLKLIIAVDDPEVKEEAARREFNLYCDAYGLDASDYGRAFGFPGQRYRLIGFAPKRSKWPIRVEALDQGGKILLLQMMAVNSIKAARPADWKALGRQPIALRA